MGTRCAAKAGSAVCKGTQECAKGWADDGALRVGWGEGTAGLASSGRGRERHCKKRIHLTRCKGVGLGTGRDSRGQRRGRQNCSLGRGQGTSPGPAPGSTVPSPREGHRSSERLSNSPRSHSWMSAQAGLKSRSACISLTS